MVGRSLVLNGEPYEIVGVLDAGFDVPREVMPTLGGAEHARDRVCRCRSRPDAATCATREDYNIVGKLKPGVGLASAQAEMDRITARLRRDHPAFYPPNGGLTFSVVPLREQVVGNVRQRARGAHGRGRARAADRVRERREPAAGARGGAPAGNGRTRRARRGPGAAAARAARREPAARARGRAVGVLLAHEHRAAPRARVGERAAAATRSASDADVLLFTLAVSVVVGLSSSGSCRRCG